MKAIATTICSLSLICSVGAFAPQGHHAFHPLVSVRPSKPSALTTLHAARLKSTTLAQSSSTTPTEKANTLLKADTSAGDDETLGASDMSSEEYKQGFAIISFITLLNASLAPVWHTVFAENGPPPLFLNAIVSVVALIGLLVGAPLLDKNVESMSALADNGEEKWSKKSFRGGMELGVWKGLGTTCHIFGLSLTTANHGAFLLQLTTLIVPILQSIRGEKIPNQIKLAVFLALGGIAAFTQDPGGAGAANVDPSSIHLGDALCVGAAIFYSFYDIQTFYWGREVPRTELVTIKIGFQAILSCLLCAAVNGDEVREYLSSGPDYAIVVPTILWSGLIVNALATFLQVGGMQAVGPTRAQTIFASQPLWAGILNFVFLGEVVGAQGFAGGGAFLGALFLAATAKPDVEAVAAE